MATTKVALLTVCKHLVNFWRQKVFMELEFVPLLDPNDIFGTKIIKHLLSDKTVFSEIFFVDVLLLKCWLSCLLTAIW